MQVDIRNITKVVQCLLEELFVKHLSVKLMVHLDQSTDRESLIAWLTNGGVHRVRVETSYFLSDQFSLLLETLPYFFLHDIKLAERSSLYTDVVTMASIGQLLRNTVVECADGAIRGLHRDKFNEAKAFGCRNILTLASKLRQSDIANLTCSWEYFSYVLKRQVLGKVLNIDGAFIHFIQVNSLDIERYAAFEELTTLR